MAGKPTVPPEEHERIRELFKCGMSKTDIALKLGRSNYTIRKALEPDFAGQERARHRSFGAERYLLRKDDQEYQEYQKSYADTDHFRHQSRSRMAQMRAKRKHVTS